MLNAGQVQAPARDNSISTSFSKLTGLIEDLARSAHRLNSVAAKIDGPEGQPQGEQAKQAGPPPTVVGSLDFMIRQFADLNGRIDHDLQRIENAIG